MRIVIDMQEVQKECNLQGTHLATLSFLQALVRTREHNEVILALCGQFPDTIEPIRAAFNGILPQKNIRVWSTPSFAQKDAANIAFQNEVSELIRDTFLSSLEPDVLHISGCPNSRSKKAHTGSSAFNNRVLLSACLGKIGDLRNSEKMQALSSELKQNEEAIANHIEREGVLLADAEILQAWDLEDLGALEKCLIRLPSTIDADDKIFNDYDKNAAAYLQSLGIVRPFVMAEIEGSSQANIKAIIQSYAAITYPLRKKHQLVLVCNPNSKSSPLYEQQDFSSNFGSDEIIWINKLQEGKLSQIYKYSELYIHTGSGNESEIPEADAMSSGELIIGINHTALPSVIGFDLAQINPGYTTEFTAKIEMGLCDKLFRSALQKHSLKQESRFAWDNVAKHAINALEKLASTRAETNSSSTNGNDACENLVAAIGNLAYSKFLDDKDLLVIAETIAQNHPPKNRLPKLFVDISDLVRLDHKTGIQRVTKSILLELLGNPPLGYGVQAVYATTDVLGYRIANKYTQLLLEKADTAESDTPIEVQPGDVFLGLDLQHTTTIFQESYLTKIREIGARVWFVVYDLLPIHFPEFWPKENRVTEIHQQWLLTITKFDGVACISESVAKELEEWLQQFSPLRSRPLHIEWFHLGADLKSSSPSFGMPKEAEEVLKKLKTRDSFLMVGTIEPRKGHAQVLTAFELLWRSGLEINLVLVGKQGWLVDSLLNRIKTHPELGNRLLWLNGISDEFLLHVYNNTSCLIAASYGEGFGLPLIEAAQFNLPLIVRDIPIFREVAGSYAFYFQGNEAPNLAEAIEVWLSMDTNAKARASQNVPRLNWRESAMQLQHCILRIK